MRQIIKIIIEKHPKDVVRITANHGGYLHGECLACGAGGWLDGLGYPHHAKNVVGNHLRHKPECPMNAVLTNKGKLKR